MQSTRSAAPSSRHPQPTASAVAAYCLPPTVAVYCLPPTACRLLFRNWRTSVKSCCRSRCQIHHPAACPHDCPDTLRDARRSERRALSESQAIPAIHPPAVFMHQGYTLSGAGLQSGPPAHQCGAQGKGEAGSNASVGRCTDEIASCRRDRRLWKMGRNPFCLTAMAEHGVSSRREHGPSFLSSTGASLLARTSRGRRRVQWSTTRRQDGHRRRNFHRARFIVFRHQYAHPTPVVSIKEALANGAKSSASTLIAITPPTSAISSYRFNPALTRHSRWLL